MRYKNIILIFFLLLLTQCGYNSVYKDNLNKEIKISVIETDGNKEINNLIISKLKKHFNQEFENKFEININSNLSKNVISKNLQGKVTNYELEVTTRFEIFYQDKKEIVSFKENLKIKNIDDSFEQKQYENLIKDNFTSSIYEKLLLKLNTF